MNILNLLILLDVFLKFKHMCAHNKDVIKNILKFHVVITKDITHFICSFFIYKIVFYSFFFKLQGTQNLLQYNSDNRSPYIYMVNLSRYVMVY